jgi:hypothetical protein
MATLAYIVFKACECRLVNQLTDFHSEDDVPQHNVRIRLFAFDIRRSMLVC